MADERVHVVLDQISLIASDVDRTLEFYGLLGVGTPSEIWRTESGVAHHAAVEVEGTDFDIDSAEFAPHFNAGWQGRGDIAGRVIISFRTETREEVDALFARVTSAGHKALQPPYDAFWGARYAIVEDPDGAAVGIMSPVDPAKRGRPPEL